MINSIIISEKVSNIIKKEFNSELVYKKKQKKTKKKKNLKVEKNYLNKAFYISVIVIDSVYRKDENYYLKMFLEKYNSIDDI